MTKQEISKLVYAMRALYSVHYKNYTADQYKAQIEAWTVVFEDVDFTEAQIGLKMYAMNDEGYPPTPGQLRKCIEEGRRKMELANTLMDIGCPDQIEYNVGKEFMRIARIGVND